MLHDLYSLIYGISYPLLACIVFLMLAGSAVLHAAGSRKVRLIAGTIGSALILWLIIYSTLLSRSEEAGDVVLQPGYSISLAFISDVYMRMVIMNIFLFIPLGIFITLAFSDNSFKTVVITTLVSGFIVTFTVELLQFIFRLGCAETDDVICNFLGCAIGLLPYVVVKCIGKDT